jgi:hypothetical protein
MTRLTMKVAGTKRIAAVAIGVTIPKKPTKLIAAKTARTVSTARMSATSRALVAQGRRADSLRRLPELPNFRGLAPLGEFCCT